MNWNTFLDDIFLGDVEIIETMQRLVGYASTGDKTGGIIVVCHGEGRNGRSTFYKGLQLVFGNELEFCWLEMLGVGTEKPNPLMLGLRGVKLAVFPQIPQDKRRFSPLIPWLKCFASDQDITARAVHAKEAETFRNTATPFLDVCGDPPALLAGYSLADRSVFIPFPARFVPGPTEAATWKTAIRSEVVMEGLGSDVESIRDWIGQGAKLFHEEGLVIPDRFRASSYTARRVA